MSEYQRLEKLFMNNLELRQPPVAVAFLAAELPGIPKFEGVQPSGCSFWKMAAEGRVFATDAHDHYNCPIGSYTHNIALPEERANELGETLQFMTGIGYLRMEEVPDIPRLPETPAVVVYAPLGKTPVDPDVVLFWGPPGRVMVLQEAAIRAGVGAQFNTLPRPTCMVLPAALAQGTTASTGCVGNRVYTGLGESDLYVAVPGKDVARIAEETAVARAANATLMQYHQDRKQQLVRM
jgi:uncharacterized protein (DUF169 family)